MSHRGVAVRSTVKSQIAARSFGRKQSFRTPHKTNPPEYVGADPCVGPFFADIQDV